MDNITITPEYQKALDFIEKNKEGFAFITGKAGTGKSTFLQVLREKTKKKFACVAPTGIAALHIKGETIHSFFKLNTKLNLSGKEGRNGEVSSNLKQIDILIIDEISMVRADLLDRVDAKMRACLGSDKPFGGKMIVAIGDLFQLPPVIPEHEKEYYSTKYSTPFFFGSNVMNGNSIFYIEFKTVFRQSDERFISLLNSIRIAEIAESKINAINQKIHIGKIPEDFNGVTLCTTNYSASNINNSKLSGLKEEPQSFLCEISGDIKENRYPNDEVVTLKKGAKVVFIKNSRPGGLDYRNGETGVVKKLHKNSIDVEIVRDEISKIVHVKYDQWDFYKYSDGKAIPNGTFRQIPVRLGWAITIHKSQGMSINDEVIIDTGRGCFAEGQFYVAMSRVVDPKKVKMKNALKMSDIKASKDVLGFVGAFGEKSINQSI